MSKEEIFSLYAITDETCLKNQTLYEAVEAAIRGGITCLQYRNKHFEDTEENLAKINKIQKICKEKGVPFIVNDNVLLTKLIDADGVHIGQKDMNVKEVRRLLGPEKIIGVTAKTVEQARLAYEGTADYIGSGAIFVTETKKDATPLSIDTFRDICKSVPIPVVAIGGINIDNLHNLKESGASGVAIINGIFGVDDIEGTCRRIRKILKEIQIVTTKG